MTLLQLLRLGNLILKGPDHIFSTGEESWRSLECNYSFIWHSANFGNWRSVKIYCDSNGSDEEGYLIPLVRFATWHRQKDMLELRPDWPNIIVVVARFDHDCEAVQNHISKLQEAIQLTSFIRHGLNTRREPGDNPLDKSGGMNIYLKNGWQTIERSILVDEAPELYQCSITLENELHGIATIVNRSDWHEFYECTPDLIVKNNNWHWDGKPIVV